MRLLVLCTHNSARSQMAEGWLRHLAAGTGLELDVWSAGTEATRVKDEAIAVMREVGIDLTDHRSKTLWDVPDPWQFDLVLTVCDDAHETCPSYPARTLRRHVSVPDPSGDDLARWREVRDALGRVGRLLVDGLAAARGADGGSSDGAAPNDTVPNDAVPDDAALQRALRRAPPPPTARSDPPPR